MESDKKAYTLTIIYDSKTGDVEYAEESIEKLKMERVSDNDKSDISEDIRRLLKKYSIIGEA